MRASVIGAMAGGQSIGNPEIWFDPSDLTTMRQEITGAAATTPVAVGDPIGSILNKGTIGGWATASASVTRPILGQSAFGKNYIRKISGGVTRNLLFSPAMTSALDNARFVMVYGGFCQITGTILGGSGSSPGQNLHVGLAGGGGVRLATFGDSVDGPTNESGNVRVITAAFTATGRYIRQNGAQVASSASTVTATNTNIFLLQGPLSDGGGESRIYGLVIQLGATITDAVRNAHEQYQALGAGVTFTST